MFILIFFAPIYLYYDSRRALKAVYKIEYKNTNFPSQRPEEISLWKRYFFFTGKGEIIVVSARYCNRIGTTVFMHKNTNNIPYMTGEGAPGNFQTDLGREFFLHAVHAFYGPPDWKFNNIHLRVFVWNLIDEHRNDLQ